MATLFGWDLNTWDRALKWAGMEAMKADDMDNPKRILDCRRKWFERGGPASGPTGSLILN